MSKVWKWAKKEIVLICAVLLAIIALFFVRPPIKMVFQSIDYSVLSMLFCLMIIIQAFRSITALDAMASFVLKFCKSVRALFFSFVTLIFFLSMVVTNDVALLTFVPLSLIVCKKAGFFSTIERGNKLVVELIVLETIAANLGSSFTPMGNPQNLFLFSHYKMTAGYFFKTMSLMAIPSVILLLLAVLFITRRKQVINSVNEDIKLKSKPKAIIYSCALIVALLAVFRVISYEIALGITCVIIAVTDFKLFAKVDYSLLITFVGFFVFTGCISSIPEVSKLLSSALQSSLACYVIGIIVCQVISNVPAAILLSSFTTAGGVLLLATDIGGLGTIIASLASVISLKLYTTFMDEENFGKFGSQSDKKSVSFMKIFTLWNVIFLVILALVVGVFIK